MCATLTISYFWLNYLSDCKMSCVASMQSTNLCPFLKFVRYALTRFNALLPDNNPAACKRTHSKWSKLRQISSLGQLLSIAGEDLMNH